MHLTTHDLARFLRACLAPPRTAFAASEDEFAGYPDNQVLAIFDDRSDAAHALSEAAEAGIASDDIAVYSGESGAEDLDSRGTEHGVSEVIQRSVQFLFTNQDDLSVYHEAVERGGVVVAIHVEDDDAKLEAASLLQRHNGHDVRHFGSFVVEDLDVDPSRVRAD